MSRRRFLTVVAAVVACAVVAVGCASLLDASEPDRHAAAPAGAVTGWTPVAGSAGQEPSAVRLPHAAGDPGPTRVRPGLPLPTNRWYSGMFFGDTPQPVYGMPLTTQARPDGIDVDLPAVDASSRTITGTFAPAFRLGLPTDGFAASRTGPVAVTSTYSSEHSSDSSSGQQMGRLTLAEGWPYLSYTALRDQAVTVPSGLTRHGDRWLGKTVAGATYGVAVTRADGTRRQVRADESSVHLAAHESLVVFAAPDRRTADVLARGAVPLQGVSTGYALRDGRAHTRLTYRTLRHRPTVLAAMPHHRRDSARSPAGRIRSVYGPLRLFRGRTLTTHVPALRPRGTLDLSGLSRRDRAELRRQVRTDAAATLASRSAPQDTYFGGKDVYRIAQLYRVAKAAGAGDAAGRLRARAVRALDGWLDGSRRCPQGASRCFYYDTRFRGVVGRTASFGADQFNDHHFHYGYFLAAAALVGRDHPALLDRWRPTLTALAEDIASPGRSQALPALRMFDPYAGHSWASGTAPFGDGNNQESSSEAVNAWNGLALWAAADGHRRLARQARWQLSLESAARTAYWLDPKSLPQGYDHPFVSLNWGGKREWATWFSDEPSAILGIQLIPMPPVLDQVPVDPRHARAALRDAGAPGLTGSRRDPSGDPFGDYLTMYLARVAPRQALTVARHLPDSAIDAGDTRSYLLAWVLAHAAHAHGGQD